MAAVDISDLPAPPPDISDLPAPPSGATTPASSGDHFSDAASVATSHPFTTGVGLLENALSGVTGAAGSVADAVTFADPGTHDWAYRPRSEAGQQIANLASQESSAVGRGYDTVAGTGPLAQTLKERVPEALNAVGTVTGLAEAPHAFAKSGLKAPETVAVPPGKAGGFTAEDLAEPVQAAPEAPAEAPKAAAEKAPAKPVEPIKPKIDADGSAQYTPEQKVAVTQRAWERVGLDSGTGKITDPEAYAQARADYEAHPDSEKGKVLSTDIARDLSHDYNDSKEARSALAVDVHEPSSAFIKQLYADKLAEAPKGTEEPLVMFTAGGTGAGKTSGIKGVPELQALKDRAQIVYDTNMNKTESSVAKIDQAAAAGKSVHAAYVYRDPVEAFANGTLPRAERQGRTVPIEEQQKTHVGAYQTAGDLRTIYANDPRVTFSALDNSLGKGKQAVVPYSDLAGKRYNAPVAELRPVVESQLQAGKISKRVYNGTLGKGVENVEQASNAATSAKPVAGAPGTSEAVGADRAAVRGSNGEEPARENSGNAGAGASQTVAGGKGAPSGDRPGGSKGPTEAVKFTPPEKEGATRAALPTRDQATREQTLRAIGLKETRHSAVSGDTKETGTDFQTSKLDNAAGTRMTNVINNERETVRDYADSLVKDSGGSTGTDQSNRRVRGQRITAPIEAYDKSLEDETRRQYKIADQRAAGVPIELAGTKEILKNNSAFLGTTEGKQLLEGVQARAKELGLSGPNETFNPATVAQAESLRQYLNENWSPRTSRLIGALKGALDLDVAKAAGADIYAAARKVRTERAVNLEEPKGIAKLAAPDDRLGINRQVAHEDVGDYVANLSADQFGQVVNVLKASGKNPKIAPQAATALNEIRAHFANEVKAKGDSTKGMWNEKAVNQYLQDNNANMAQVFTPEELKRFQTLNDAGNILRMDRTYPGAAAQGHNFVVGGVLSGAEHGATVAGAALGHIPGAVVGHGVGKIAGKVSGAVLRSNVEKRIRTL